jgi:hypothetical protein
MLISVGRGALMAKMDIQHAFRLVPVRPADWPLLGYKCGVYFYFDIVLPFGSRSSPYHFCLVSDGVHWIFTYVSGHYNVLHYVDDFLIVTGPDQEACKY